MFVFFSKRSFVKRKGPGRPARERRGAGHRPGAGTTGEEGRLRGFYHAPNGVYLVFTR